MINFEEELNKILKEDPLEPKQKYQIISIDQRLKDSFEEINVFIDEKNREPEKTTDIVEKTIFSSFGIGKTFKRQCY